MRKSKRVDIICLQFDNLFYLQWGNIYCLHRECILGCFPLIRTGRPDHGWSSHFDKEEGFSQEFLLKNHLLYA